MRPAGAYHALAVSVERRLPRLALRMYRYGQEIPRGSISTSTGGGMDLIFPHHECEIAQAVASQGDDMVHYWMHNNMITINGQKMGKSLGISSHWSSSSRVIIRRCNKHSSAMTIRFFILQAHYRSTVDFSNEALQAAEKGLSRLMEAYGHLMKLKPSATSTVDTRGLREKCFEAMNDDLNSPIVISHLFDAARAINSVKRR